MTISTKSGEHGTTNIYFDGGADQHLDPFVEHGKTWIRTVAKSKPVLLKTSDTKENGKRWLSASLAATAPRSVDSYGNGEFTSMAIPMCCCAIMLGWATLMTELAEGELLEDTTII